MDYLVHHGIKGQEWGVKNGPPYPIDHTSKKSIKKARSEAIKKQKEIAKNRSTMTDAELKAQIERLQLEIKLRDLTEANLHPGRDTAKKILVNAGQMAVNTAAKETIVAGVREAIDIAKKSNK